MNKSIFETAIDLRDVPEDKWPEMIGHGYRSCCYTVGLDKEAVGILFGYDTAGNAQTFIIPHKPHVKYRVSYPTNEKDIYGNYVAVKHFRNSSERKKWIDAAEGIHIVEALKPEQEILQNLFGQYVLDSDFNVQDMRTFYLDIETEISDQFMSPAEAKNRINMITVYDTGFKKFITWSLENANIDFKTEPLASMDKSQFELRAFNNNEIRMLEDFVDWWSYNYPDVVCGYNSKDFDIPYIAKRIDIVLNKSELAKLSPIGKVKIREVNHAADQSAEATLDVEIEGIFSADELVLYRDKFQVKAALDGGYSLNNVGEAEGLGKKIQYSGTLKDLYEKNYQMFYEYNVRDVDLLKRIEEKCKLIPLARRVAGSGLVNYDAIYSSISYLIGSLIAFSKYQMGGAAFQSYLGKRKEATSFEGAYVFPPISGLYKGGVATIDFNSLYPSTIRALNLSPETYIGKVIPQGVPNPDDEFDIDTIECNEFLVKNDEKTSKLTKDQLRELCKTRCIFTRNNVLILKHEVKQGVVSAWCKHFYGFRKSTKKRMQKLDLDIYNKVITDPEEIAKTKVLIQNLDNIQQATKIQLNSIYGILGTNHSPIFNVDIAQSITRNGKFCNMSAAAFIKKWMIEKFKLSQDYRTPISGDTDSVAGNTKIRINKKEIEIKSLYDKLLSDGNEIHIVGDYEIIDCTSLNLEIQTKGNVYVPLKFLSRHKTKKCLYEISVNDKSIAVTSDHVCMRYCKENFFENIKAKDLNIGDYVSVYDSKNDSEVIGVITDIKQLNTIDDYVYDCEVEDDQHCFYANDILVHNSQFVNIQCITEFFIKKFNLSNKIRLWPDEYKLKLWKFMDRFVEETVNPFVQGLVRDHCYTEHADVLRYSLEYIGDAGIYEKKKRYCVHKVISEGPELVDKLKYTGIELKRSNVSPEIKQFLQEIYENTILNDWTNDDYRKYINETYRKFSKMGIDKISFWKGWNSDKVDSSGFLQDSKGMTSLSKACHRYNDMIAHLKIGKKYNEIKLGDKIRFCYIQPNNPYGIDTMAFAGEWPEEFNSIFQVNYPKMFTKSVLEPLKSFREATQFEDFDPANNTAMDIFAL